MVIETEARYAEFKFNEKLFTGYWISNNETTLTFYVGNDCFLCKNCQKNIDLFDLILNK
jgi:hypothetical protein